jgi:hypothetical protein
MITVFEESFRASDEMIPANTEGSIPSARRLTPVTPSHSTAVMARVIVMAWSAERYEIETFPSAALTVPLRKEPVRASSSIARYASLTRSKRPPLARMASSSARRSMERR